MTTDIDTNEKVDTQKMSAINTKLTPLTNRKSNMTTENEYESYSKDADIDTNKH